MFLLQKWPDAFSPDLAMSLNNQSDSVSELERREKGRLVLVGLGRDATVHAPIRVSAPPGSPVAREMHCISYRSAVYDHQFCAAWVARPFSNATHSGRHFEFNLRTPDPFDQRGRVQGQRGREPLLARHAASVRPFEHHCFRVTQGAIEGVDPSVVTSACAQPWLSGSAAWADV
jgi:hypothetical protein